MNAQLGVHIILNYNVPLNYYMFGHTLQRDHTDKRCCMLHRARQQEQARQAYYIDPRYPGFGVTVLPGVTCDTSTEQLFTLHPTSPVPLDTAPAPTPHTPMLVPPRYAVQRGDSSDAMFSGSQDESSCMYDENCGPSGPLFEVQIMGRRLQNVQ